MITGPVWSLVLCYHWSCYHWSCMITGPVITGPVWSLVLYVLSLVLRYHWSCIWSLVLYMITGPIWSLVLCYHWSCMITGPVWSLVLYDHWYQFTLILHWSPGLHWFNVSCTHIVLWFYTFFAGAVHFAWGHTTESMCIGYMCASQKEPAVSCHCCLHLFFPLLYH